MSIAAIHGIHELIEECLGCYPGLIWYESDELYLLLLAIVHRQVNVYNLVYQMTRHVVSASTHTIDEHKDLVEKGEKWMKDTASSSALVVALIVTVSFAAIFTFSGGNKNDGTPNFPWNSTFMLFAISDAVALFSSVTFVLMFLAMLTLHYKEIGNN
ncbi:hypothetical protein QQ045_010291 [Rhodiola kirilowii]